MNKMLLFDIVTYHKKNNNNNNDLTWTVWLQSSNFSVWSMVSFSTLLFHLTNFFLQPHRFQKDFNSPRFQKWLFKSDLFSPLTLACCCSGTQVWKCCGQISGWRKEQDYFCVCCFTHAHACPVKALSPPSSFSSSSLHLFFLIKSKHSRLFKDLQGSEGALVAAVDLMETLQNSGGNIKVCK